MKQVAAAGDWRGRATRCPPSRRQRSRPEGRQGCDDRWWAALTPALLDLPVTARARPPSRGSRSLRSRGTARVRAASKISSNCQRWDHSRCRRSALDSAQAIKLMLHQSALGVASRQPGQQLGPIGCCAIAIAILGRGQTQIPESVRLLGVERVDLSCDCDEFRTGLVVLEACRRARSCRPRAEANSRERLHFPASMPRAHRRPDPGLPRRAPARSTPVHRLAQRALTVQPMRLTP